MSPEVCVFREQVPGLKLDVAIEYICSFNSGGFGCIWLHHENGTQLAIMINRNLAYPHFFPSADHPGFQIAPPGDADWDIEVDFRADNHEPTPMPLALVVPIQRAIEILRYFWNYGQATCTEKWSSLIAGEP